MRGDFLQGAPDLLEVGLHLEKPPTLTDEFESDTPDSDAGDVQRNDGHLWTCPSCSSVNAATAGECWSCKATRPSVDGSEQSTSAAAHGPHAVAAPDSTPASLDPSLEPGETHAHEVERPSSLTMSDGSPPADRDAASEAIDSRSATLVQDRERAGRRRRQAILASAVSLAAVLAVVAYVVNQQTSTTGRSQVELPHVIAKRTTAPAAPAPAVEPPSARAPSLPPTATSEMPPAHPPSPELASPAVIPDAAPDRGAASSPAPMQTSPPSPCSAPASALGLCDAEQSSTTRR
jgi:hypothetical protein